MSGVVGELPHNSKEWKTELAGTVVLGGAAVASLLWRAFAHSRYGKHIHQERKAFFAYWFWGAMSLAVMHLFLLFQIFYFDRDGAGRLVNWTRWVFYIFSYGICANGMVAEFQLQPNSWTRYYTGAALAASFIFNMLNAFCDDHKTRLMLGGLSGAAIGIYAIQLAYFDGRWRDRMYSFFITFLLWASIGAGIAMFVVGHANKRDISRADEFIGYLVIDCVIFFIVSMLMKSRWMVRSTYFEGIADAARHVEYGLFSLCFSSVAAAEDVATAPLAAVGA